MSTHNICFRGEIRKTLCGYPLLSVAMKICFHGKVRKNMNMYTLLIWRYNPIILVFLVQRFEPVEQGHQCFKLTAGQLKNNLTVFQQ